MCHTAKCTNCFEYVKASLMFSVRHTCLVSYTCLVSQALPIRPHFNNIFFEFQNEAITTIRITAYIRNTVYITSIKILPSIFKF